MADPDPNGDSLLDTFVAAAEAFERLVGKIPPNAWDGPGLGDWDLRALVGHTSRSLITVETYLHQPAEQEDVRTPDDYVAAIGEVDHAAVAGRGREAGLVLGHDPQGFVTELVARVPPLVRDALADGADPLITTIFGGMRLSRYVPTRTFELVVHGLDLTTALGWPAPDYPPAVLREALDLATGAAVASGHGPEVLRALTGRKGLPDGFSVV